MTKKSKIFIVGAGIGDPEMMTLKAKKVIESADVILYDALVNDTILEWANPLALKLFVGKRKGCKPYSQADIQEMLIEYAENGNQVVRLKGGDPFVFGRGREEMTAAQAEGIDTEYIAGISSAIAAPASIGIPVTYRGVSQSFWVMTATNESNQLNPEIAQAAATQATVVILMGWHHLQAITHIFLKHRIADTPIAVIQNASLPNENAVVSDLENIVEAASEANLGTPAVIVIGEVVQFANVKRHELHELNELFTNDSCKFV
jgi:uroporphyrin-III C-methyltransferase